MRLNQQLSALLVLTVLLTVTAMGAVVAWNLRSGFGDYVRARDGEALERLSEDLSRRLAAAGPGQAKALSVLQSMWPELGGGRYPPPLPPPPDDLERPPPPPGGGFEQRVALYTVDGVLLAGHPAPDGRETLSRPLLLDGQRVAVLRLPPPPLLPQGVDARFLRRQYWVIAIAGAALLLTTLTLARLLAARWVRPLIQLQRTASSIATGAFDVRMDARGGDEIADLVRHVNDMAASLERLEQGRRRWIAELAHELRTPLTVLQGELEALEDGVRPLTPAAVISLREEVRQLSRLAEDLYLLAIADLKGLPCEFAADDAPTALLRMVRRFEARAEAHGLRLMLDVPIRAQAVCWDAGRIEQLLDNLLENSLRYTDAPGVIWVRYQVCGQHLLLQVEDSAPAVPAADIAKLFDPLYRADPARSRHAGGSGLGMAICTAIVRAHGGEITAALASLGGLDVRVSLPLAGPAP